MDERERPLDETSGRFREGLRPEATRDDAAAGAFGFLREMVARQAAERAERRARYVADTVDLLSASLDYRESLRRLAALLVPSLADYCIIDIVEEGGEVQRVALAHADPRMGELAQRLMRFPADLRKEGHLIGRVIRTGEPLLLQEPKRELDGRTLEQTALNPEHLAVMREIAPRSLVAAPLHSRGETIGAITLLSSGSGKVFDEADRALVTELADRAGLAIDNARLFTAEQRARLAAERLQVLTAELGTALTTPEVARTVLRYGVSALGADAGVLALLLPAGDELEIVDSVGYAPEMCMGPGRRWPASATIPIAEATRTGESVVIGSPQEWADRYLGGYAPPQRTSASAAWAAIPVQLEYRVAGSLLWTYNAPRRIDPPDLALMETVARLCSQALERARLLEAERVARAAAEEANRAKMEFLSAMSHELRTPLNAIAGYVDLLDAGLRGDLSDLQRGDLKRIKRAQEVLLGLIDEVLHFARVEAGRVRIQSIPVPLSTLLDDLDTMTEPQVREKGLTLRRPPPAPGLTLRGDPERVRQIVLNLVSNAVKFTDVGGTIDIEMEGDAERVRIHVRDTGRGIPADKLEAVFAPFVQLERERSSETEAGVGLGLAISRELALAMGGELVARNRDGAGTEFVLALPRWSD